MGAGESKGQSAEAAADTVDYYQLLEVDENRLRGDGGCCGWCSSDAVDETLSLDALEEAGLLQSFSERFGFLCASSLYKSAGFRAVTSELILCRPVVATRVDDDGRRDEASDSCDVCGGVAVGIPGVATSRQDVKDGLG